MKLVSAASGLAEEQLTSVEIIPAFRVRAAVGGGG